MVRLSKNFTREEFACKCGCGQDTVDSELISFLQTARNYFNKPIYIHSGNRCEEYNKKVGGAKNSQHLISRAADITIKGVTPTNVAAYMDSLIGDSGGVGSYTTFTHIDTRGYRARWNG